MSDQETIPPSVTPLSYISDEGKAATLREVTNINYWGMDYYDVDANGDVYVCPNPDKPQNRISLNKLAQIMQEKHGAHLPALFCFPQIIKHRLRSINRAFTNAIKDYGYKGNYTLVYPIKVNQHRRVIEALKHSDEKYGLEAGSKAELLAVIAHAGLKKHTIVCNGYKDREYVRYALMAEKLGHKVYIVIEKISEIDLVLDEAKKLDVVPRLGVRARLASQGAGKWQSSGGEKSKFGLSSTQVLSLVEILREANYLDCLQLLHFHLGSQLGSIRDIATGVRESARFYVELAHLGVKIKRFDVGGGLGVDYDGSRTTSDRSVDYGLREYAETIVWGIGQLCDDYNLPHPDIFTESGRAITAHHALLISNVIGVERYKAMELSPPAESDPTVLHSMWETWSDIQSQRDKRSLRTWIHEGQFDLEDVHRQYNVGTITLPQRAYAEQLYLNICSEVAKLFSTQNRSHRQVIDELQERFADKVWVNFSLFQSLPDAWGINQQFPVVPITLMHEPIARRAVLLDITCDSDGLVDDYIDGDGIAATLPIPDFDVDHPPLIGFFMLGAYQETLGNMHNLFGDTTTIDLRVTGADEFEVIDLYHGNTVSDMLSYVYIDPKKILEKYREEVHNSNLSATDKSKFLRELELGLSGYTYLEEETEI
ncbi:biosynthetic arginine decarboxylase [Psittacicella hinzii]|uniref:Arginine decarboxylase n=1 Tax=Psittacicella hinzii TaxID=2028575 RepID=A0A3A1YK14_9GAMM|nr:biosynthetic arginine decarboxylase [Psittacicella hinzii]RIY38613.1 arginine decarboxylase [Psittacicella hinzii]